jgi:hypothetical protein
MDGRGTDAPIQKEPMNGSNGSKDGMQLMPSVCSGIEIVNID